MLVQAELACRSFRHAVERLGKIMVVIPADKILAASAREFATADLQDGAADDASPEERLKFVHDVPKRYELMRTETAKLRSFCSRMMCIHMLAHHTTGAGWSTEAQLWPRSWTASCYSCRGTTRLQRPCAGASRTSTSPRRAPCSASFARGS